MKGCKAKVTAVSTCKWLGESSLLHLQTGQCRLKYKQGLDSANPVTDSAITVTNIHKYNSTGLVRKLHTRNTYMCIEW